MEADALAGLEADHPYPRLVGLRQKLGADAAVRPLRLARELGFQRGRPLGLDVAVRAPSPSWTSPWHSPLEYGLSYSKFCRCGMEECVGEGRARAGDRRIDERPARRARAQRAAAASRECTSASPSRSPGRGAGIVAQPELKAVLRALGLDPDRDLGIEVATRRDVCARRPRHAPRADRADHDGVGPRVSSAESGAAGGELSPRQGIAPRRAGRAASSRISPTDRPPRATCWSAPTASARPCASNISPTWRRSMRATRPGAG